MMGFLSMLMYRRPAHVETRPGLDDKSLKRGSSPDSLGTHSSSSTGRGIPTALSFDKIIDGSTCPPCTIRDFMNYLIYIEHGAENLQFFLWYRDYVKRFEAAQNADLALAKEWTPAQEQDAIARMQHEKAGEKKKVDKGAATDAYDMFKGTDFEKRGTVGPAGPPPYRSRSRSPSDDDEQASSVRESTMSAGTHRTLARETFPAAGAKAPFTNQPFREEINRVITTYVVEGAPRQLNLSWREQGALMAGLAYTTHPSALRIAVQTTESTLRSQSHPNFVRWSISNGNPSRLDFARIMGITTLGLSLIACVLLTLSKVPRGYRAIPSFGLVLGVATLVAAHNGMCVVLHALHKMHLRPWELFVDEDSDGGESGQSSAQKRSSFESFGFRNSYEKPSVARYEQQNTISKVFGKEVWVQEPVLRHIQDTIFLQSMLVGVVVAAALTAVFVAVPGGGFF